MNSNNASHISTFLKLLNGGIYAGSGANGAEINEGMH